VDYARKAGQGEFGAVYHGVYEKNGEMIDVAVKVISAMKAEINQEDVLREINILSKIQCENVAKFYGVMRTVNNLYLINELCDDGSLYDYMIKKGVKLTEEDSLNIIKQITKAFIDMSKMTCEKTGSTLCIFHRDLKPQNIMLHKGIVKIIDFGFSKTVTNKEKHLQMKHTVLGTRYYVSPQILDEGTYSAKNDVWAAGIIFYEMLVGKKPWTVTSNNEMELFNKIAKEPLKVPEKLKTETQDLLKLMLQVEDGKRASWEDVWNHPALKSV